MGASQSSEPAPAPAPSRSPLVYIWPPPEDSMPALITFIVLQLTLLAVIFGRPKKQSAYILAAKEEKRVRRRWR